MSNVTDNLAKIAKNLRLDDSRYEVFSCKVKKEIDKRNVQFTDAVWGDYDAPVNKTFSRNEPQSMRFIKGDELVVVKGIGCDTGATIVYITRVKDEWYFMRARDAEEFLKNIEIIKSA